MNDIVQNFQFIRPLLLLAAIPVLLIYLLKLKFGQKQNLWQQLLPQHLYQRMVISKGLQKASRYIHYALFAWLISVFAIAGPTWEKLPQAVYQTQAGKVILMDMSMSMRATDLAPNRLTRARFKASDLINQVSEGETGLVAYSGDAFVISPLTDDANTLLSLIPSLKPEIMPTQGSSALRGLEVAAELLTNAGYQSGQIYWLTDGILYDEINDIRRFIQQSNFDVSALLVGTETGAPIQLENGKLLKDSRGSIVVPSINSRYLNQAMSGTDGTYSVFASDNSDIAAIKRKVEFEQQQQAQEVENTTGDVYKDMGPYLLLLVLPFAAYAFRRGLMAICVVSILSVVGLPEQKAYAAMQTTPINESNTQAAADAGQASTSPFTIKSWFKNADQRGKEAFDNKNYNKAQALFESQTWRAASAYKNGDYQKALDLYSGLSGTENTYNQANALAKLGKLQEALDQYNEVLKNDPEHENALRNKAIVEELIKQLEQQQEQQGQQDQENGQDGEQNQDSEQNSEQSQEQNSDQNSQEGDSSKENGEQSEQEQQDSDEPSDNQDKDESQSSENQNQSSQQDEDLQRQAQQQNEREQNSEAGEQEQSPSQSDSEQLPQEVPQDQQQEAVSADQFDMTNMTPEEKEEMQRMQMIMNKVPDDPAYLLQRKMMLEAYKRERQPVPTQENW